MYLLVQHVQTASLLLLLLLLLLLIDCCGSRHKCYCALLLRLLRLVRLLLCHRCSSGHPQLLERRCVLGR
jgi:hypothetical protein